MIDILVVEDGLHERERLTRLFGSVRYKVHSAESATEAESLLRAHSYRLAVIDIGLGDKSGSHLFELLKRLPQIPYVIVLTGNPSTHLKQRFLDDGVASYIVKASPAASNEALVDTVRGLLGNPGEGTVTGIPLGEFLRVHVSAESRELFLDESQQLPSCNGCGSSEYLVQFNHKTQLPPTIEGRVVCAQCGRELDPQVG